MKRLQIIVADVVVVEGFVLDRFFAVAEENGRGDFLLDARFHRLGTVLVDRFHFVLE